MAAIYSSGKRCRRLFPSCIALGLCALALVNVAGAFAAAVTSPSYAVYLPFAGKPIPTSTATPTPTATPLPPAVHIDPACSRFKGGSAQDPTGEYVCFRSDDWRPIIMTGWRVEDRASHRYVFPTFVLNPGATVRLHSGRGTNTATDLYWGSGLIWNNDHDTVYLYDASGILVDSYSY